MIKSALPSKKKSRDRLLRLMASHPDWVVGLQDEVWWSRLARPDSYAWVASEPMRLHQVEADEKDTDPKALACCGPTRAG